MSLICDETGRDIEFGDVLWAGTRRDVEFYSALSEEALGRIPESEKRPTQADPIEGGVDIYEASSSKNFNGSYTLRDFALEKFRYSVSEATAQKHLPNHMKKYPVPVVM